MKKKMSNIMYVHYIKLFFRSGLFLLATTFYIYNKIKGNDVYFWQIKGMPIFIIFVVCVFGIEMLFRFCPSNLESPGCQKQFKRNFIPVENTNNIKPKLTEGYRTFLMLTVWIVLSLIVGFLYYIDIIDPGFLILLSLALSVFDIICIVFFCPFQSWILKNRCCTTCRIYNWDFAMMFTPFIFIPNKYTNILVILSFLLLIEWEVIYRLHPERFSEDKNEALKCKNCGEKLCHHKKQIIKIINKQVEKIKKLNKAIKEHK